MKRVAKITIICDIEIDDETDVTNESELYDALREAVHEDLFSTQYLDECIEIYCDKVKEVVYSINDNPSVNNVLDSFKAFMYAMWSGDNAEKV